MSFFRRLFGGNKAEDKNAYRDPDGIYFYVACDRCQTCVRVRVDKRHDLNDENGVYRWQKTIVDNRCFQRMTTVVEFDRGYNVVTSEIEGGHYVSEAAYNSFLAQEQAAKSPSETEAGGPENESDETI